MIFAHREFADHEQVVFVSEPQTGLRAIIAVHSTRRGPALGGCRCWPYTSEADALTDVLRLSRAMTYKSAAANVALGGGKSVIILPRPGAKTPALIRAMGSAVAQLGGRYILGEDIGTDVTDMGTFRSVTPHVLGAPSDQGGSGDPSPMTALGCFVGIAASVHHRLGRDLHGVRVVVQGLGNVGAKLAALLHQAGAQLLVADVDDARVAQAVRELGATRVPAEAVVDAEADVLAPCAFGAVINDDSVKRLRVTVVAGGANNQLARAEHGEALRARKILYAPDYVINGGGLIALANERIGYQPAKVEREVRAIAETLREIYGRADAEQIPTSRAADALAEKRIAAAALC
jgi:leucine dehydrogenase